MTNGPSEGEIEVSIFGRGYGESILVHVGDSNWIVVDSLRSPDRTPAPLSYFTDIQLDTSTGIRLIVATHWHDDHVGGISDVYEAGASTQLALPVAMRYDEVNALFRRCRNSGSEKFSSGVSELGRIAVIQHRGGRPNIRLAGANQALLRIPGHKLSHGNNVSVEALSPCDADVAAFIAGLANLGEKLPASRLMPFERNDVSVVLWVSIGPYRILLGADLENSPDGTRGWQAILTSPAPVDGRASILKIPHHGSANGHHQSMWDELLTSQPIAVLTPWNRGRKLPTETDVDRITAQTPYAYSTNKLSRRSSKRPAAVERTIREARVKLRSYPSKVGHVRLRLALHEQQPQWRTELLSGAIHLSAMAA